MICFFKFFALNFDERYYWENKEEHKPFQRKIHMSPHDCMLCFVLSLNSTRACFVGRFFVPQGSQVLFWSNGRLVVDICPSGQDQYNQCWKTQAHHCQNRPGFIFHVPHSWFEGRFCGAKRSPRDPQKLTQSKRKHKHQLWVITILSWFVIYYTHSTDSWWGFNVQMKAHNNNNPWWLCCELRRESWTVCWFCQMILPTWTLWRKGEIWSFVLMQSF